MCVTKSGLYPWKIEEIDVFNTQVVLSLVCCCSLLYFMGQVLRTFILNVFSYDRTTIRCEKEQNVAFSASYVFIVRVVCPLIFPDADEIVNGLSQKGSIQDQSSLYFLEGTWVVHGFTTTWASTVDMGKCHGGQLGCAKEKGEQRREARRDVDMGQWWQSQLGSLIVSSFCLCVCVLRRHIRRYHPERDWGACPIGQIHNVIFAVLLSQGM